MPNQWKKNSKKVLRLEGKEYISESGKMRPSKMVMPTDCTKCRFQCSRISEEKRKELFQSFYSLKVYERQKDFICGNVPEKSTKTVIHEENKLVPKRRKVNRMFSFNIDGQKERVCKNKMSVHSFSRRVVCRPCTKKQPTWLVHWQ